MKLSKLLPPPLREFLRQRLTIYVYTYGFRPSKCIAEQTFTFMHSGRSLSVKADHRTALYDMIAEVVDYDCYQLGKLGWEPGQDGHIVDIGANVGVTALRVAARIRNLSVEVHDLDSARNLQTISVKLSSLGYKLSCIPDMWERSALHLLLARRV